MFGENYRLSTEWYFTGQKRKRGRPRTTWRRTVESGMKAMQHSLGAFIRLAQDRQKWKDFVVALDTTQCNGSC